MAPNSHAVPPRILLEFFGKTLPFCHLEEEELDELATRCSIEYYPKGTIIFRQNVSDVTHLCLIQKGGVKVYFEGDDAHAALKDYGGEGLAIGALSLVTGDKADFTVEAIEDTFCFLLERRAFLDLIQRNPRLAQYFLQGFSENFVQEAYCELRYEKVRAKDEAALYLFSTKIQALIKNPPELVQPSTTIRQAAARMAELGIGSLLVRDPAGGIAGIVTDTDLRKKVVALGLDYHLPVEKIMSSPVRTVSGEEVCFEALLQFITYQIEHLVIEHRKQILGVVTALDIMAHRGAMPLYLFRDIASERDLETLCTLAEKVPFAVRTLIEEGAKGENITRMITLLNDSIAERLLSLLTQKMGPPPVPFTWLTMGSDGRREQTFRTDQDNAIVYRDPVDDCERQGAENYFTALAEQAVENLVACGYPRCKTGVMASNPRWRKPYSMWVEYFDEWMTSPEPKEVSLAAIFFDVRPVFGEVTVGQSLRHHITDQAQRQHMFLRHLASDCLRSWPPLSFFRNVIVERDGEHKNRLNIKTRGLSPFVNFARLMALRFGIPETNTLDRLRAMAERGHIGHEFYTDAREAFEFQIQLKLVHQLRMVECGLTPDTFLDPSELSELERKTLKEVFAVIDRMLDHIKREFPGVV